MIRGMLEEDRDAVRDALVAGGAFTEEEVEVALVMVDEGLAGGPEGDYPLFTVEVDGRVRGYACVGRTPLTASTWHLYWICVHPAAQGAGAGRALQSHLEAFVRARGGERLVVETSGRADYERARRFYRGAGYQEVGLIRDYYKPGDDCLLYCKALE